MLPELGSSTTRPLIVNYGMGTDSTAMLIEMARRRIVPDLVITANTGSEKPWTYVFNQLFSNWLTMNGMPPVLMVQRGMSRASKTGPGYVTIEGNCIQNHTLPSLAFGRKACSLKWKAEPMDRWLKDWWPAINAWSEGRKPTKLLGYDSGKADSRRAHNRTEDERFLYRYPLREWGWTREICQQVIAATGLPDPGKSACFFCPASKPQELVLLATQFPDLWMRAVAMEDRAQPTLGPSVAGLWRRTSWRAFGQQQGLPLPPLPTPDELVIPWRESEEDAMLEAGEGLEDVCGEEAFQEEEVEV